MLKTLVFLASLQAHAAIDTIDDVANTPIKHAAPELEIFVVDEEQLDIPLDRLSDDQIFGPQGLTEFLQSYEPEAAKKTTLTRTAKAKKTCISQGKASWYGKPFHGRKTASGSRFNMNALTAAHRTLPFGTRVRVTYNGRSVTVTINDRGPFTAGRMIDLSKAAAAKIGLIHAGHGKVTINRCAG